MSLSDNHMAMLRACVSKEFVAGYFAGGLGVGVTHPLDTVRTRIQNMTSSGAKYSYAKVTKDIVKNFGVQGMFRGIIPPVVLRGLEVGINRFAYDRMQRYCRAQPKGSFLAKNELWLKGAAAGASCGIPAHFTLMLKNKAQCLNDPNYKETLPNYWKMLVRTYRTEGFRGLGSGGLPNISFYTLTFMQFYWGHHKCKEMGLGPAMCGIGAAVVSWPVFYPLEVVRTIAMTTPHSSGQIMVDMVRKGLKTPKNIHKIFWPGLNLTMVRAVIRWAVTFQTHAWLMYYMDDDSGEHE